MGKTRKGLFSKEHEKKLAQMIDDAKKWKNPLIEMADGKISLMSIMYIDNVWLDKIPDEFQNPLEPIIDKMFEGDYLQAADELADIADQYIDIPGLDKTNEHDLIYHFIVFVAKYLYIYCLRHK